MTTNGNAAPSGNAAPGGPPLLRERRGPPSVAKAIQGRSLVPGNRRREWTGEASCGPSRTFGCGAGGKIARRQAPRSHQRPSGRRASAALANLGRLLRERSKLGSRLRSASRSDPDGDISPSRSAALRGKRAARRLLFRSLLRDGSGIGSSVRTPPPRLAVGGGYAVRAAVFGPTHNAQAAVQSLRALRPRESAFGRLPTASHRRGLRRRASNALRLRASRRGHAQCAFHGHAPPGAARAAPAPTRSRQHMSVQKPMGASSNQRWQHHWFATDFSGGAKP